MQFMFTTVLIQLWISSTKTDNRENGMHAKYLFWLEYICAKISAPSNLGDGKGLKCLNLIPAKSVIALLSKLNMSNVCWPNKNWMYNQVLIEIVTSDLERLLDAWSEGLAAVGIYLRSREQLLLNVIWKYPWESYSILHFLEFWLFHAKITALLSTWVITLLLEITDFTPNKAYFYANASFSMMGNDFCSSDQ